jgi:DNA polymerase-4
MRESGRTGSTVTIRLRFGDFTRSTSSHTLARPTAHTLTVLDVARRLLASRSGTIKDKGITLIGVSLGSLDDQPAQLALPLDVTSGAELDDVIDAVRSKFGGAAVRRAVQLGSIDPGAAPHLPD